MTGENPELTERQQREVDYHREHAARHAERYASISWELLRRDRRRWWNQQWAMFTELLRLELPGKRVLVVGCGFGDDAFQLARLGCQVHAFDLSADVLEVGRAVARRENLSIDFACMPAEQLRYADGFFDALVIRDILHHVEIPPALAELSRVSKPGAAAVINEVYTHSALESLRRSALVNGMLYPALRKLIYGRARPYITPDERKLTERDLALLRRFLGKIHRVRGFDFLVNRVLPNRWAWLSKIDYVALNALGPRLATLLGGRLLIVG
ncbi:MAG: class I SAM-dependent methyltransferase, partial [Gemmataceae bacterium]